MILHLFAQVFKALYCKNALSRNMPVYLMHKFDVSMLICELAFYTSLSVCYKKYLCIMYIMWYNCYNSSSKLSNNNCVNCQRFLVFISTLQDIALCTSLQEWSRLFHTRAQNAISSPSECEMQLSERPIT